MPFELLGAVAALLLWVVFAIVVPLGPPGAAIHLLLGVAGVLFVRWWARRA